MKNAHLMCCAANRTAQRMYIYASRFGFLRALHLNIFEQSQIGGNKRAVPHDTYYFQKRERTQWHHQKIIK